MKNLETTRFQRALRHIAPNKRKEVAQDIMAILHVRTRTSYYLYLDGKTEMKVSQAAAVEKYFNDRGITDVWGGWDDDDDIKKGG